jgi:hypothetical protein
VSTDVARKEEAHGGESRSAVPGAAGRIKTVKRPATILVAAGSWDDRWEHAFMSQAMAEAELAEIEQQGLTGLRCLAPIFPFLAGRGSSLFAEVPKPQALELVSSSGFDNGMVGLV